jgi:hypothetical protein
MILYRILLIIVLWGSIATASEPLYFDTTVLPILTKAGCNSGACHGATAGRGGFRLSLWGSDPSADYSAVVHEWEGRRVDRAVSTNSLLLKKPAGLLDHEGGVRLPEDSAHWRSIESWIRNGVNRSERIVLERLAVAIQDAEIGEDKPLCLPLSENLRLRVRACFAGEKVRDVTDVATISIPDASALRYDESSQEVESLRPGIHSLVIRFLDQVTCIQIVTPFKKASEGISKEPIISGIDFEIEKRLGELNLTPYPVADDLTLLRRATLDLTGRLPTESEVQAYSEETEEDKYERLIDRLLASPHFTQYWTYRWSRILGVRSIATSPEGLKAFYQWLKTQIDNDAPWDEVTGKMLTATGDSHEIGPAFFMLVSPDARGQAEQISKVFMGIQIACANCHDHPLDRWKQQDYHGLAAIFARLQRDRIVRWNPRGFVTNPQTGQPALARIPGDAEISTSSDARGELNRWLFDATHPYAARAFANRLWAHFFGRGLVEPVDDIRATNPASHPELLDRLTEELIHKRYSLKHFMRDLVISNTYRRRSAPVQDREFPDSFYVYGPRKSLTPEVTLDLIGDATGTLTSFSDTSLGTRAISLEDPKTPSSSLDSLGRCSIPGSCASEAARPSLAMMLHWINGDTLNERIADRNGTLARALVSSTNNRLILDRLYLLTLNRPPTRTEVAFWIEQGLDDDAQDRKAFFEDLFWSLLTSNDFLENH